MVIKTLNQLKLVLELKPPNTVLLCVDHVTEGAPAGHDSHVLIDDPAYVNRVPIVFFANQAWNSVLALKTSASRTPTCGAQRSQYR